MFGERDFTYIPNVIDSQNYVYKDAKRLKVREMYDAKREKIVGTVGRLAPSLLWMRLKNFLKFAQMWSTGGLEMAIWTSRSRRTRKRLV